MSDTFTCKDAPDLNLPAGVPFPAKLIDLKRDSYTWESKTIEKLVWYFEIQDSSHVDQDGNKRVVRDQTTAELNNRAGNKFREWAEALLGRDIPVNMQLSMEDLVGLPCMVLIEHKADKKNKDLMWDRIDLVLPADDQNPPF